MSFLVLFLIVGFASWGATRLLLLGVSEWWKCANQTLSDDELQKAQNRAYLLVSTAFMIWAIALLFVINTTMGALLLGVLQQAGVDVSSAVGK